MKIKVSRNSECPCGSGRKFKHCCIDKDFEWTKNSNGEFCKRLSLDEDCILGVQQQIQKYSEVFGREPGPNDRIFFNHYFSSDEEDKQRIAQIMKKIGVDPAIIYAFKKTGRLVSHQNRQKLTTIELEEWDEACEEYQYIDEHDDKYNVLAELDKLFERCIYVLGMLAEESGVLEKDSSEYSLDDFVLFCVTRTHRGLRSILKQKEAFLVEDAHILLRSIYESYLNLIFVLNNPLKLDDLVAAKIGLSAGTHEYGLKNNGKINWRVIINKNTRQKFEGQISSGRMAKSSGFEEDVEIHRFLYEYLSNYTHPNILSANSYLQSYRVSSGREKLQYDITVLALFLAAIVLGQSLKVHTVKGKFSFEVTKFLDEATTQIIQAAKFIEEDSPFKILKELIIARLNRI